MFKKLILPALALIIFAVPHASSADAHKPSLYGVLFYADWCGSCKVLDPQLQKARGAGDLDSKNVLFVKMDLTNKITSNQSALLAKSLGFGDFYKANDGKTGHLTLIDPANGQAVAKITKEQKSADIVAMIDEKLATPTPAPAQ